MSALCSCDNGLQLPKPQSFSTIQIKIGHAGLRLDVILFPFRSSMQWAFGRKRRDQESRNQERDNMSLVGVETQNLDFQCDSKQPSESTVSKITSFHRRKKAFAGKSFQSFRFSREIVPHKSKHTLFRH